MTAQLGNIIKDACAEKGWSQRELARRAGIPPATVQKIVATPGIVVRVETLAKLSKALGLPTSTLLEAVAADSGYTRQIVASEELDLIVASLEELPPAKLREVASLVEAMLATERASG